jgi:hypothetical protein
MGVQKYKKKTVLLLTLEIVVAFAVCLIGFLTFGNSNDTIKNHSNSLKNSKNTEKNKEIMMDTQKEKNSSPNVKVDDTGSTQDKEQMSNETISPSNGTSTAQRIVKPQTVTKTTKSKSTGSKQTSKQTTVPTRETSTQSIMPEQPSTSEPSTVSEPASTPESTPVQEQPIITDPSTIDIPKSDQPSIPDATTETSNQGEITNTNNPQLP